MLCKGCNAAIKHEFRCLNCDDGPMCHDCRANHNHDCVADNGIIGLDALSGAAGLDDDYGDTDAPMDAYAAMMANHRQFGRNDIN